MCLPLTRAYFLQMFAAVSQLLPARTFYYHLLAAIPCIPKTRAYQYHELAAITVVLRQPDDTRHSHTYAGTQPLQHKTGHSPTCDARKASRHPLQYVLRVGW